MSRALGGLLALLVLTPLAAAHGELLATLPADRSVVGTELEQVSLNFSEPVEVPFSIFKVYPLDTTLPEGEVSEREWQRLSGLAATLVGQALTARDDEETRVDSGVTTDERRSQEILVALEEELPPGAYVLMWRVLSIDTHITQGFVTFIVADSE